MSRLTINFDSIYAQYSNDNNPLNSVFVLSNPIRKVKSIALKSLELPVAFSNIRANLNVFSILMGGTTYSITLTPSVYTSMATLCSDLTTAFNANSIPSKPTFSVSGNYVIITVSGNVSYSVVQTNMSRYILGFNGNQASSYATNSVITGQYNYLLNVDNYVSIYINNIPHSSMSFSNKLSTFKIPLNCISGVVYFTADDNTFHQKVFVYDDNFVLDKLNVQVLDRFGYLLNNNGLDFSMTLEIVHD